MMKVKHFYLRLSQQYLQIDQESLNNFLENIIVKKTVTELIDGQPKFWSILVFYEEQNNKVNAKKSDKISITNEDELSEEEKNIYAALKQWRQDKASKMNVPSFVIAHNAELISIAKVKPKNIDELAKIKGFALNGRKISKYGDDIIAVLNSI